jgi:acetyl-CoA/propionyl-CoA carboxylase biotin carboxyl carrier protein
VDSPAFAAEDGAFGVYTTWIESEFAEELAASPEFTAPAAHDAGRRTFAIDLDGRRMTLGLPESLLAGLAAGAGAPGAHQTRDSADDAAAPSAADLTAAMGGTVVKWLVEPGTEVEAGDGVVVLEAMKMETTVQAHRAGTVGERAAAAGDAVVPGTVLTTIAG